MMEYTGSRDHDVRDIHSAALHMQIPAAVPEPGFVDLLLETDKSVDAIFAAGPLEVGLDFVAGREVAAPVGVAFEAVGIVMRWRIASQARVGIFPPCTADPVRFLVDDEVFHAGFEQLYSRQDAGHACPDDDHA